MEETERVNVLGVPIDMVDMVGAIRVVKNIMERDLEPQYVLAINPEKIIALNKDYELLNIIKKSALLIPDGIGAVWAAKLLANVSVSRVTGIDLMENICAMASARSFKVFIYGAKEDVNKKVVNILTSRYSSLSIVGHLHGYESDNERVVKMINESGAQILFVALGSPRQERWISENYKKINVKIIQGVGGAYDAITGEVKRAPVVWQNMNIEWLYRLIKEPNRIKRQIVLPKFVLNVIMQKYFGHFCKENDNKEKK